MEKFTHLSNLETVIVLYILSFIFGFAVKFILKNIQTRRAIAGQLTKSKNINKKDRITRAVIGIALLLFAMFTTWNMLLIFASGFCIFEAIFSWCVFNQMIGKNTCDM